MDMGTTIVGAIFIALFILPFVLMNRNRKQRERALLTKLKEFAIQHNCNLDQSEIFGNYGIGIDASKSVAFYCKRVKEEFIFQFLDLQEVQSCKIINLNSSTGSKGNQVNIIDRLDLGFIPKSNDRSITKWSFYAAEEGLQITDELSLIAKWNTIINDRLKRAA